MTVPTFVIGIDLGTTHCAVAYSRVAHGDVELFPLPQLVAPGEVVARDLLPSFLYLPADAELPAYERTLPWGVSPQIVGELARALGAKVPNRMVASAKNWICHGGVNRRAPILPWSAPEPEPHVSPFEASMRYLAHLRAAWDTVHPDAPMAAQDVVVTVPASFDDGARALTAEAAEQAGLGAVRLLEEPQAAFYDFVGVHEQTLASTLGDARLILVVDVGGGTTDLTLLRVVEAKAEDEGRPRLERIAVGGHIMLGGDNMDAALAHLILRKAGIKRQLDPAEWSALVQSARRTKDLLLGGGAPDEAVVSVQHRGSRLIGGTRSVTLGREEVRNALVDGFLPTSGPEEVAAGVGHAGLTTLGLPYAADPAITRHVCAFLRRHVTAASDAGAQVRGGLPRPDLLLLNGGVFKSGAMCERLLEVLAQWYGDPVPLLEHTSLDTAVARGAAYYGVARRGRGRVIAGGLPRAYYIGVEGPEGGAYALCVAPKGMEEGTQVNVRERIFELVLDRRVGFPLFACADDRADPAGQVVSVSGGRHLEPLPPLEAVLRAGGQRLRVGKAGGVPVTISTSIGEAGVLELYLVTVELPPKRWRLEFALREDGSGKGSAASAGTSHGEAAPASEEPLPPGFNKARRLVRDAYCGEFWGPAKPQGLRKNLEGLLGPRGLWSAGTCRALWEELRIHAGGRGDSPDHELNWLRLAGWCLRPGVGFPGDPDRVARMWQLHDEGLMHTSKASWVEWWIVWRRAAAGLERGQQDSLFEAIRPWLDPDLERPSGPRVHGEIEMLRLVGALERVTRGKKEAAGRWLLERAERTGKPGSWWTLGRLGAREPFYGDALDVVSPKVAEAWLDRLLALDWRRADGAAFAAALLARVTGDVRREVGERARKLVTRRLEEAKMPASWVEMVSRPTTLSDKDAGRLFGDSLPAGLRLTGP